ncbi:TetR/AcrR family transcriptional regulator C-terminal domain-containing protein [Streptomyces sp. S.PNR 29]|uniref:TetR/AcrR family transcriptional regulator C-terminal domain-containing protein n=1 Tax=Streptomyces sp. S.PNR 29 TaxID=2973805 RepID=UPI0025B1F65B|nr:TetR/AcrR family transcriptional regulator C-terminal domain-containing protein [Streptomyces sp. S.PNR 29]MDN0199986.1 TetR/AcrR family transcriptional regulator C-terminal domain-containing protein [Streptomyces sp. S.PNR 29]
MAKAKDRTGAGDPARTLELLWREAGHKGARRGPKQQLSIDVVVQTAIELADRDGLDTLTMRRIAQELGVTPMTLYTYIPGKAELLDVMLDTVYQQMPRTEHPPGTSWRTRVTTVAHENRALFRRHPWAATLPSTRPALGPGLMAKYERELGAFEGTGLDDIERDAALTHLLAFVQSTARTAHDAQAAHRDSAMSDEQWWAANAPLLARVFDPARYPLATRVGSAAGAAHQGAYNPDHTYEFGLRCVLDGFAALIDERGARPQAKDR